METKVHMYLKKRKAFVSSLNSLCSWQTSWQTIYYAALLILFPLPTDRMVERVQRDNGKGVMMGRRKSAGSVAASV